jgi:hypothetical protein
MTDFTAEVATRDSLSARPLRVFQEELEKKSFGESFRRTFCSKQIVPLCTSGEQRVFGTLLNLPKRKADKLKRECLISRRAFFFPRKRSSVKFFFEKLLDLDF